MSPNAIKTFFVRSACWLAPCLLYLWAVGGAPRADGPDLLPAPDAEEYALLAMRLAHFQAPLIPIGAHEYPSRYSLAYPAALAPAALILNSDATRFWLATALFGLLATGLMAAVGGRLLGSRAAGALSAAFFALHPQTARAGVVVMSETAILMMFFLMLALALPWLEQAAGRRGGAVRAALLGAALGWLTITKAPFSYWALACALLLALDGYRHREWRPFAALVSAGAAFALGDLLYRRWAFGVWTTNGYKYWVPQYYEEFFKTFNLSYLREAFSATAPEPRGNLVYYGRMLLGLSDEFYGRYMAPVALAGTLGLAYSSCFRRKQTQQPAPPESEISKLKFEIPLLPSAATILLLAGWALVGGLFCGLYFFQEARFPHLWIPLIDFAAAWALVALPRVFPLHGLPGRLRARRWAQAAALLIALFLLRGEYRRVRDVVHNVPGGARLALSERLGPLLAQVPQGAWLFTNYKPVSVDLARPEPGPTASLYSPDPLEAVWLLNMHAGAIDSLGLRPRRRQVEAARRLQNLPRSWENKPAELIGLDGSWSLAPEERRAFFSQPSYALIVRPASLPSVVARAIDERILPLMRRELALEPVRQTAEATLYRLSRVDQPAPIERTP